MATAAQAAAARTNGAQSHGPSTAEGKARSARNSLKHGFTAQPAAMNPEARAEYESILAALIAELQPTTEIEDHLVEGIAVARWRLNRIRRAQEQLLEQDILAVLDDPEQARKLNLLNRYEKDYDRQFRNNLRQLQQLREAETKAAAQEANIKRARFYDAFDAYINAPTPGELASRNEPGAPPIS